MKILSPQSLWKDVDMTAEPLDVEYVKTDEKDGYVFRRFYFTGRTFSHGAKTRVFGVSVAKNTNVKKSALLLIDNPAKPIDEGELLYWAQNGFAAMAIDMRGLCEKGRFTVYPTEASYANSDEKADDDFVLSGETAAESKWFEYAFDNMRAVTYLLKNPQIKDVSVISVGKGVGVGLMVLGVDKRVSRGSVIFGNLYTEFPSQNSSGINDLSALIEEDVALHVAKNETEQAWTLGLSPQSYVPLITVPLYVVCSGNSSQVDVVKLSRTYFRTNDDSRLLIVPNTFDYLTDGMTENVVKWFKGKTVPDDMKLAVVPNGNKLTVSLETSHPKENLELWYCRNGEKKGKNWLIAELYPSGQPNKYYADLELYENNSTVYAVAVANGDISVSTELFSIVTKSQYALKLKTTLIYSGESDVRFVPVNLTDKWHGGEIEVSRAKGYLGIVGKKGNSMGTFAANDSAIRNPMGVLGFDVCCDVKQKFSVFCIVGFGETGHTYYANTELIGNGKWQRVIVHRSDFRDAGDRMMDENGAVDMYIFHARSKFIINNVSLV